MRRYFKKATIAKRLTLPLLVIALLLVAITSVLTQESYTITAFNKNTEPENNSILPTRNEYGLQVKIHGYVEDEGGDPVIIYMQTEVEGQFYGVLTQSDGYYEIYVPVSDDYRIDANPVQSVAIGTVKLPVGYMQQSKIVERTGFDIQVDFTIYYGATLWLKMFDPNGNIMYVDDLVEPSRFGAFYINDFPYGHTIQAEYNALNFYWGWDESNGRNPLVMLVPLNVDFKIWGLLEIPNFGMAMLEANNDGDGFNLSKSELLIVNMIYEFAKTECQKARQLYDEAVTGGYTLSGNATNFLYEAETYKTIADGYNQVEDEVNTAEISYQALSAALKAKEQIVLDVANQDIEKYRKTNVSVLIFDHDGNPIPDVSISYTQINHDFVFCGGYVGGWYFGLNGFEDALETLRKSGFEYVHIEIPWSVVEFGPGQYNFQEWLYDSIAQKKLKSVVVDGGEVWISDSNVPIFYRNISTQEFIQNSTAFLDAVIDNYKDKIWLWNIFNEPDIAFLGNNETIIITDLNDENLFRIVSSLIEVSEAADPNATYFVNIGFPAFKMDYLPSDPDPVGYEFLSNLNDENILPNAIGLEFYFGTAIVPIDMATMKEIINLYESFGKPIIISEAWYPSYEDFDMEYLEEVGAIGLKWHWHGNTDEDQSEWAKYIFTLTFSNPSCIGVAWQTIWDETNHPEISGCGLFDKDFNPRPVFFELSDLIKSWTTTGMSTSNSEGLIFFRGFAGEYKVNISAIGYQNLTRIIHVRESGNNTFTLILLPKAEPASITNLAVAGMGETWINWTWNDPVEPDFSHVMVYMDGMFKTNVSKSTGYYNASGLYADTSYTIATHTVDTVGNINQTWVNLTTKTAQAAISSPPPRAGGGGGGGGAAPPAPMNVLVDPATGDVKSTTTLTVDGATLTIPQGTIVKDAGGNPLSTPITMLHTATIAESVGAITAYDYGPSGSRFSPPIDLVIAYDPADIPQGFNELDLVIRMWDGTTWVDLDTTIDTVAHKVTAKVQHFTLFALFAILGAPTPLPTLISPIITPAATPTPTPTPPLFKLPTLNIVVIIALVVVTLIIAGAYKMLRRR